MAYLLVIRDAWLCVEHADTLLSTPELKRTFWPVRKAAEGDQELVRHVYGLQPEGTSFVGRLNGCDFHVTPKIPQGEIVFEPVPRPSRRHVWQDGQWRKR
jgi:hypothetical protein